MSKLSRTAILGLGMVIGAIFVITCADRDSSHAHHKGTHAAAEITFDNGSSGLAAMDVQAALDEVRSLVAGLRVDVDAQDSRLMALESQNLDSRIAAIEPRAHDHVWEVPRVVMLDSPGLDTTPVDIDVASFLPVGIMASAAVIQGELGPSGTGDLRISTAAGFNAYVVSSTESHDSQITVPLDPSNIITVVSGGVRQVRVSLVGYIR